MCSSLAIGQAVQTPFSTFGIGEPYGNALIQNQGMGGIGISQPQYWSVNNQNPALLVFNYYTCFQAGALVESRSKKSDTLTQKGVNGNLNYLVTAFPVKPGKWTTSFGLMPYTKVNYKLAYTEPVIDNDDPNGPPIDTAGVLEVGDGGLTQMYWSNGVRINDDFAIGLKIGYLFGSANRDYSNAVVDEDQAEYFIVGIREKIYAKDLIFSGGLSFSKDSVFKNNLRISAGLVYSLATKLKGEKTVVVERRVSTGTPITSDTLESEIGSVNIPASLIVGFSIGKDTRWSAGAEFSTQDWSQFKNMNNTSQNLENAWKVALGGEITPNGSANNYFKRITYRVGLSYEKTPYLVENPVSSGSYKPVKDVGINFGLSLPTRISSLDLGFRYGKRGDKAETLIEESYYKIYFGITFNDKWFIKRKFD